ncbi:protein of unknown function [Bartonella clarridgeiae 73]|uniref:Uncharacterized protein n=1 Tax=Bartonella clarridgeiae (strain CCUG 45776 / CIP 104772 / 73) TaxID=696125 RepID=E6YHT0_BARC7|nr:protein of unknown function [Bartonella clarridgeiae 73]
MCKKFGWKEDFSWVKDAIDLNLVLRIELKFMYSGNTYYSKIILKKRHRKRKFITYSNNLAQE